MVNATSASALNQKKKKKKRQRYKGNLRLTNSSIFLFYWWLVNVTLTGNSVFMLLITDRPIVNENMIKTQTAQDSGIFKGEGGDYYFGVTESGNWATEC